MLAAIEVTIDAEGRVCPRNPVEKPPVGRALVILLPDGTEDGLALAEPALAADWLRPEEEAAWAHLQPAR